jgi:hypothetical protein
MMASVPKSASVMDAGVQLLPMLMKNVNARLRSLKRKFGHLMK